MITDLPTDQLKIWQENDMEHLRYEYDLKPDDLVIDLGAYQGEFSRKIHDIYGCHVISVEPTNAIAALTEPWARVINKAAWIRDEVRTFGGSAYWTSSILEGSQRYECFDINTILNREIALLKINIEGDEYELLLHILNSGLYKNIRNIQVQFHQVDSYPKSYEFRYSLVTFNLSGAHFIKTWGVDWIWENWKRND